MSDNFFQKEICEGFRYHSNARYAAAYLAWLYFGLIAIALISIIIFEIGNIAEAEPVDAVRPYHVLPVVAAAPTAIGSDSSSSRFVEILARPLFRQSRRPLADTALAVADLSISRLRLTGVIVSSTGGLAIFAGNEGGKSIVVRKGDRVGPAIVDTIAVGQVILRGPDGTVMLRPVSTEAASQVSPLSVADLAIPGYRPRQDGHHAAFWKTVAAAQPHNTR